MVILGISAYYHDSAAAILADGHIVAAACEERFSRIKHDNAFPVKAIQFCVNEAGVGYNQIDYVVFYEKPIIKFERILTTHIYHAPKGLPVFLKSMPIWLKERLNLKTTIIKALNGVVGRKCKWNVRFTSHHLSHAAMAYFTSGYSRAAILVIDAVGEKATTSILMGTEGTIRPIKQQVFPHSIGLLYSSFTYFLGFKVNSDEYKVMGLAPYGDIHAQQTQAYIRIIERELVDIGEDGSIELHQKYFTFMYDMEMIHLRQWERLFHLPHRVDGPLSQSHKNLAAAIQYVTEKILLRLSKHVKELTRADCLCVAGGCALNCVAMGKIKQSGLFKHVFVPFASGDDGGALGSALLFHSLVKGITPTTCSPYLGPSFTDEYITALLERNHLTYCLLQENELYAIAARLLAEGKIIGWFQGKMEFGPRALGNRSILADPRVAQMKDAVNARIKFREEFRPFAPVVLEEDAAQYFRLSNAPYMTFTTEVTTDGVPAVTHIDHSARIQTVCEAQNAPLYHLLKAFKRVTHCPVLLNTSFNVMGEPIVCTPEDALNTFVHSGLDVLIVNNYMIEK